MNLLWLINMPLTEVSLILGEKPLPYGGWLENTSKLLSKQKDINLSIAFPSNQASKYNKIKGEFIYYYPFNPMKYKDIKLIDQDLKKIVQEAKPDIVHIHGTEMLHAKSMVNICKDMKVKSVISIQGLISIIGKHMYSGLPFHIIYGKTIRNLIRKDNVSDMKKSFLKRGRFEKAAIRDTKFIIGRTTLDKACITQMNHQVKYFHCDEILRDHFYENQWEFDQCEKYSLFVSQGQYPIKGLHFVLEAMPFILKKYPMAKLYISGRDITKSDTIKNRLMLTNYARYIRNLISKLKIENHIVFTGPLDEKEMCKRYLKSHVFICPSSIENSPNSLGEAMILGVPCIASYAGGIPDMLKNKEEGFLYQHDAPYMLAHYVCELFENKDLTLTFSRRAHEHASHIYDREKNIRRLNEIYDLIIKD